MKKRQLIRESIMKYAEKEFKEKGYSNSRVEDIAFNSGNAKATIYNYFDSKDDILAAIISKSYKSFNETMSSEMKENNNKNDLKILLEAYIYFDEQFPFYSELLFSNENLLIEKKIYDKIAENQPLTESENEYIESESQLVSVTRDLITKYLNNTTEDPEFLKKLVQVLAHFLVSIRQVIINGKLIKRSNEDTRVILEIMVKIIEQGITHYN